MPLLESTLNVDYKSLPFVATEEATVIYHFAAEVDTYTLPFPLLESSNKKNLLKKLIALANTIQNNVKGVNCRVFKLNFLAPGRIDDIFKEVKRPITIAKYDVVCMLVCDDATVASTLEQNPAFKELESIFKQFPKHNLITAKNIRKAGNSFVHEHHTQGVFLFNYFYVEDPNLDFLPVWEHTSRWFAEYTQLDNSYLLKPIAGDDHFQYINHCYWPGTLRFVTELIFKPSAKTFVLDNFSYNKAIAFPVIYKACL